MATVKGNLERGLQLSDPTAALHLTQQASALLTKQQSSSAFPFAAFEDPDQWLELEQLFLVFLRTGDDKSAHLCLDRLAERFGPANERIMGLRGLYQEATAKDGSSLEAILRDYNKILSENAVNVVSYLLNCDSVERNSVLKKCSTAHFEATNCPPTLFEQIRRSYICIGRLPRSFPNRRRGMV
jgi:hypothetical protein